MEQVTIRDIARKCKVGVSTVSRAMNNHPDINPETKEMILKVIAESNYVPNNSARNLKRSNAKAIAILVKGMDNMFFNNMISVIEEVVRKKKYACIIERVEEKANEVDSAIEIVKEKRLRGIIFLGGNFRESYKMVDYLCGLGHRRIAIITACEDDISIGRLRLNAYRQALLDHGIPYDPDLVFHMTKDDTYSFATGYKITKEILEKKTEFSALYATADTLAIGACRALKEAGLTVPDDISVAGFDGIDAGEYYIPSINDPPAGGAACRRDGEDAVFLNFRKRRTLQQSIRWGTRRKGIHKVADRAAVKYLLFRCPQK